MIEWFFLLTRKVNKGPGHNKQPDGEMSQNKFIDQVLIRVTTWGLAH